MNNVNDVNIKYFRYLIKNHWNFVIEQVLLEFQIKFGNRKSFLEWDFRVTKVTSVKLKTLNRRVLSSKSVFWTKLTRGNRFLKSKKKHTELYFDSFYWPIAHGSLK